MTRYDDQGRPEPPDRAGEPETLIGFLDFQRATLDWKCGGLGSDALDRTLAPSTMTLGGLLKHMAYVEDLWFSVVLFENSPTPPWDTVDWSADRDWDWHTATEDSPDELFALWRESIDRSRALTARALGQDGMGTVARRTNPAGEAPNLRWIVTHMIEEYARHNGHADLLRESIDGSTGE